MVMANAARALDPVEFRFTDPGDVEKYGDDWYTYDEGYYLRLPARELIAIESVMNMTIVTVMNGMRSQSTLGDTAAAWLGLRAGRPDLVPDFDDFNPITMMIEWRRAEGKAPADTASATEPATPTPPAADSPPAGPPPSTTSATPDLVALPILPAAEWPTS